MRLIDADELKAVLDGFYYPEYGKPNFEFDYMNQIIDEQPTVEAKPVVHGEWIEGRGVLSKFFKCNKCGSYHEFRSSYCSACGAKMSSADMRGGEND